MINQSIQTLSFLFDNKTDYIILFQIAEEGPLKRKHSGVKGNVGLLEDINEPSVGRSRSGTDAQFAQRRELFRREHSSEQQ